MDEKDQKIVELEERLEQAKKEIARLKKIEKDFEEYKAEYPAEKSVSAFVKQEIKQIAQEPGQKKGHKGYSRRIPERIDVVKPWMPEVCPDCGTQLGDTQEIRSRYVTDLSLRMKAINTRYDIHRKYCSNCKKIVEKPVPGMLPPSQLGFHTTLLVMYLRLGMSMPGAKVCELLGTLYDVSISEGEIVVILRQLVLAFGDYYSALEKFVKLSRVKHTDSTGWRINGKNYFAWVFIAAGKVLYQIRKRNNSNVPLKLFGLLQKGMILVVDRHSAFRTLAEKVGYLLQLCWAHILRDSKDLARDFGSEGKWVHRKLKEIFALASGLDHKGTPEQVDQLKAEVFLLTQRHYEHKRVWKFVNNLYYRDVENLFRFVTDPEVDATNNISERELRKLVIIRKISNGSRSKRGANATAQLLSIVETLRSGKGNILHGLQNILNIASGQ
jgi:transposase